MGMCCSAVGLPGSVTPMLWGSLTASAVSCEEKQKARCKDPSAEGERQFLKCKGGFLGWAKAACRKSGLDGVVQGVRKQACCAGVSQSPGRRRRLSTLTACCLFNRQKTCVKQSPSQFCLIYHFVPLRAEHFLLWRNMLAGLALWQPAAALPCLSIKVLWASLV